MWASNLAPDDADLGALDGPLGAVDVCDTVNSAFPNCARFEARLYVQATRLPQYQFAAAVSSTPSSFNSDVPGLVLRFLRIVSRCQKRVGSSIVPSLVAVAC